jgi:nucleotide-binding universal stress UspA family protein
LIAGALKTEDLFTHYIGSIARKIIRKADCSVLMLVNPSTDPQPFKKIVIEGEHPNNPLKALGLGCYIAKAEDALQVHVLREIKMLGLNMAIAGESSEEEYTETRRNLVHEELKKAEELLSCVDSANLKVNVKIFSGKTGYEIAKFAEKSEADLLIVNAPTHKLNILDRFFAHDLEYIMSDLPCNLLLVHH